jgi:membrane protein DedA with SNARE-associated domain
MNALQFLADHGAAVLFWVILVEQIGLPIPAIPLLIAAGALVAADKMSVVTALLVPVAASLPPDLAWFYLGRTKGGAVLGFLCRLSLEPDSCVRDTENMFHKNGPRALLLASSFPVSARWRRHWRALSGWPRRRSFCTMSVAPSYGPA